MKYLMTLCLWCNYINSITLSILGILILNNSSSANSLCYMIDANGKKVNLSFLCPTAEVLPSKTSVNILKPKITNNITSTDSPVKSVNNTTSKQTVNNSTSTTQRSIPLLQNQQTP